MQWEHRFLSQFDYAWNRRCNAGARHVALRQVLHWPLLCASLTPVDYYSLSVLRS